MTRDESDLERSEFAWQIHSHVSEQIRLADSKAEMVIGWTTVVIGGLIAGGYSDRFALTVVGCLSVVGLGLLVAAVVCALWVIFPRVPSKIPLGDIFWRRIMQYPNAEAYAAVLRSLREEDRVNRLADDTYQLCRICDKKFASVWFSLAFAAAGSALCGAIFIAAK
jgi:hypothetical protein